MPDHLKSLIVTLKDDALGDIQNVTDQLKSKGMHVNRVLAEAGLISGTCPSPDLADLQGIDGVMSVEEEAVAYLPPSNSTIT